MPGRKFSSATQYRYGYGGKEKDACTGDGNLDFGERIMGVRLGKWLSTDKYEAKYPSISPYATMMNNPLSFVDLKGDSVELIIGKPYIDANGEEHPYGHVALRVYNAKEGYDMVYDFGRYGKTWGLLDSKGEGILNVYNDGGSYLKSEMSLRSSVGYMQPTTTAEDKQVIAHFSGLIQKGAVYKTGAVPGGGGTAYKLSADYDVLNNNRTTVSDAGLEVLGLNWLGSEYDPRDALKSMEKKYTNKNLTRTEYNKGGEVKVTFKTKPLEPIKLDFKPNPQRSVSDHPEDVQWKKNKQEIKLKTKG